MRREKKFVGGITAPEPTLAEVVNEANRNRIMIQRERDAPGGASGRRYYRRRGDISVDAKRTSHRLRLQDVRVLQMLTRFPIRNFKLFDDVELEPGERVVPIGPNNARKTAARLNSFEARKRADNLQARLQKRPDELKLEAQISPLPPVVLGGVLVVPPGLLNELNGAASVPATSAVDTQASAAHAREIIMEVERQLGFEPTDRKHEKLGYDIESRIPGTGRLRFIEVKGRIAGAQTITVTKDEILYSLNKPDDFILTIVEFLDGDTHRVHYLRRPSSASPISASPASTTISANSYRGQQSRHDV